MKYSNKRFAGLVFGVGLLTQVVLSGFAAEEVPAFRVRDGYQVTTASPQLKEARFMEFDDKGNLYVSSPRAGTIQTLRDTDQDGVYEVIGTFVADKPQVHGMQFYDGWLWFTQSLAIHRGRDTNGDGVADEVVTVVPEGQLPGGKGHWWRPILVTEDGFYTSVGDSGNITDETNNERQKIWKFSLDGKQKTLFATGIRNTEKYLFRPGTKEIWGVDHGSDWYGRELGEDRNNQIVTNNHPPCEFNHYVEGGFYGHPFITGNRLPRLEYYDRPDILELAAKTIPPKWSLGAHWAPNGFCFVTEQTSLPKDTIGDAYIACHGSWNSSVRVGYSIIRVLFDDQTGEPYGSLRIVSTITRDDLPAGEDGVLARPVDCVQAPDGSILFSCDHTHRIYRITATQRDVEQGN
ncbi:MAG: hypothetical protein RBU29_17140 [bacterium]|nr:hypothetical protein [bacterium]